METVLASTVMAAEPRNKSMKSFHSHPEKNIPMGPGEPGRIGGQREHRAPEVSHTGGF